MTSNGVSEEMAVPGPQGGTGQVPASAFLRFPLEIREMIYEYYFDDIVPPGQQLIIPSQRDDEPSGASALATSLALNDPDYAIFRVSHEVHDESTNWFYRKTAFLTCDLGLPVDWAMRHPLRCRYLSWIQELHVEFYIKDFEGWTDAARSLVQKVEAGLQNAPTQGSRLQNVLDWLKELKEYLQPHQHPDTGRHVRFHKHSTKEKVEIVNVHRLLNEMYFWGPTMRTIRREMPSLKKLYIDITGCSSVACESPVYRIGPNIVNWGFPNAWKYPLPEHIFIGASDQWGHEKAFLEANLQYQREMTNITLASSSDNGSSVVGWDKNEYDSDSDAPDPVLDDALRQVARYFCCTVRALPSLSQMRN